MERSELHQQLQDGMRLRASAEAHVQHLQAELHKFAMQLEEVEKDREHLLQTHRSSHQQFDEVINSLRGQLESARSQAQAINEELTETRQRKLLSDKEAQQLKTKIINQNLQHEAELQAFKTSQLSQSEMVRSLPTHPQCAMQLNGLFASS